ncbi:tRNA (adenine(57)-N(1)/adenine(58)-N(1))-methyltransferase TrmI [Candidatus Bilamarchaeum dharawalense]|uniref:tRNA (Adenine(57)-N(1)/adenine(58)-N(1))-methyltransferase TrmI n=1 Tax=Candidatus Bilamarchaeum dharawalense TaxID=2885759 RepID=A0A5E4LV07_9ARCH|nr:tRNA (adenine(57)-N(1)/adenine(58)-N(1))-methyltransferase TrmI [Candidatus Bilamarchaeum dharawalense]
MDKPDFHFPPLLRKLKRGGPAVTLPKDAGLLIAYTGVGKESRVVELGSGTGFMTVQFANIVKEVVSYEKREEFLKIAQSNVDRAGLKNVTFKFRDVLAGIDEKEGDFDLVFCDISEAEKIVEAAHSALKKGGYLAAHCLQSEQAKALHLASEKVFTEVFTIEGIVREYEAREFGFRPKHFGLMHTAYLVFARK